MFGRVALAASGAQVEDDSSWDLSTASYVRSTSTLGNSVAGVGFRPDGARVIYADTFSGYLKSYDLNTPWDLSSLNSTIKTTYFSTVAPFFIRPDTGSRLYTISGSTVKEYRLTVGWDLTTLNSTPTTTFTATYVYAGTGIVFSPDGTNMYVSSYNSSQSVGYIYHYTMSTGYDVGSISYAGVFYTTPQTSLPFDVTISTDGRNMYIIDITTDKVLQYTLGTAWDVTTASYTGKTLSVSAQDVTPTGLFFKPDGTGLYVSGSANDKLYQYSIG